MRKTLSSVLALVADQTEVIYECRRCGTKLDAKGAACPVCDGTDVAVYEFAHDD